MPSMTQQVAGTTVLLRGSEAARTCLVQMTFSHACERIDDEVAAIERLVPGVPFAFAGVVVDDANDALSPWEAPAVFKRGEPFGSGAERTLAHLLDEILPEVARALRLPPDARFVLGGYSLAGLFSLWAGYRTERFSAIAAASPSVWFLGWDEFAQSHEMLARDVHLSLGTAEHKTRNQRLAQVRSRIELMHELLAAQLGPGRCELAWSPGDHFQDADGRMARAFAWTAQAVQRG